MDRRSPISSWIDRGRPNRTARTFAERPAGRRPRLRTRPRGRRAGPRRRSGRTARCGRSIRNAAVAQLAAAAGAAGLRRPRRARRPGSGAPPLERARRPQEAADPGAACGLRFVSGSCSRLAHAIADPGLGDDQVPQRPLRVGGGELVAELADVDVDVAVLALVRLPPDGAQQLALGDDPTLLAEEDSQQLELARGEVDGPVADPDLVRRRRSKTSGPTVTVPRASPAGPADAPEGDAKPGVRARPARRAWSRSRRRHGPAPRPSRAPHTGPTGSRSGVVASRRIRRMTSSPSMSGRPRSSRTTSGRPRVPALQRRPPVRRPPGCGSRAMPSSRTSTARVSSSSSTTRTVAPPAVTGVAASSAGRLASGRSSVDGQAAQLAPPAPRPTRPSPRSARARPRARCRCRASPRCPVAAPR